MLVKMHNSNVSFKYVEFTQAEELAVIYYVICSEPLTMNGLLYLLTLQTVRFNLDRAPIKK